MVRHLLYQPYPPPDLPRTSRCRCPHLKPWWSRRLSSLRREYNRFVRVSPLDLSPINWSNIKSSRRTYFKAIAMARKHTGRTASPRPLHTPCREPSGLLLVIRHRGSGTCQGPLTQARLQRRCSITFFPPKPLPPPPARLERPEDYTPLTSPPGPDHIPSSVWNSVHRLKPSVTTLR